MIKMGINIVPSAPKFEEDIYRENPKNILIFFNNKGEPVINFPAEEFVKLSKEKENFLKDFAKTIEIHLNQYKK